MYNEVTLSKTPCWNFSSTYKFLNHCVNLTGGIASDPKLQLKIESIDEYGTCIKDYDDYIAIGPSLSSTLRPNEKIHIKDLIKVPFYPNKNEANAKNLTYTGAMAFFEDTASGTCLLGIARGDGSCWYTFSVANII